MKDAAGTGRAPAADSTAPGASAYRAKSAGLRPFTASVPAFQDGSDSPRAYLERCIERIEQREGGLQAFVHLDLAGARRAADDAGARYKAGAPLSAIDGMPVGVKDIIETRAMPTEFNSPIFAGYRPRRDAACVIALQRAGAVIVGKTVTTEFAAGRSGPTRNPHDSERTPGGSSSGSGAAVGAGMLPAALGTQTQASVIRPSSYCGAYGFKPSHGTLRVDGLGPLAPTLDHLGVLGASLADVWAVTAVIAALGADLGARALDAGPRLPQALRPRVAVRLETEGWRETDAVSQAAFDHALAQLEQSGVALVHRGNDPRVEELERQLADANDTSQQIFAYEGQWPLRAYADCGAEMVGERLRGLIALADRMSAADYEAALAKREKLRAHIASFAGSADCFLTLASSGPAPLGLENTGSRSFAVPWTLAAAPSLALPVLESAGLPLGLQLMGFRHTDAATMAMARWASDCLLEVQKP